jgi:hypothetical protein
MICNDLASEVLVFFGASETLVHPKLDRTNFVFKDFLPAPVHLQPCKGKVGIDPTRVRILASLFTSLSLPHNAAYSCCIRIILRASLHLLTRRI